MISCDQGKTINHPHKHSFVTSLLEIAIAIANANVAQWKRISCKQNARWQHLSQLKASAFFCLKKKIVFKEHTNFYLRLVTPSSG